MKHSYLWLFFLATLCRADVVLEADTSSASVEESSTTVEDPASAEPEQTENVAADETTASADVVDEATTEDTTTAEATDDDSQPVEEEVPPVQVGPFIDLLGQYLYSLEFIDETQAQLVPHYTNDVLKGKDVIGLYFSADWCGPCRQFTPELVSFYDKMNSRRGKKDKFEIIWVSRCRDMTSYGQYFAHMNWLALPPEEAMGERGQWLSEKYKVKGIPHLVLLDDVGNVITYEGREKIPKDKAGIGFPWHNPLVHLYTTILPKSLRMLIKSQISSVKGKVVQRMKGLLGLSKATA